ncbi:MAG: Ribosome biogenesis protein 1 [Paramarteilia canceri]
MSTKRRILLPYEGFSSNLHHSGEHMLIGSKCGKIMWFDLEITTKPIKTIRFHTSTVNKIDYHLNLPIFASCSGDGSILISYGRIFNDIMTNPEIMAVKKLSGHSRSVEKPGVSCIKFHPQNHYLISGGHDSTLRLFG